MRNRLNALFYTFLVIFAATAMVALLGVVKVLSIEREDLRWLLGAFLIELAGAVIAIFKAAPFFEARADVVSSLADAVHVIDEITPQMEAIATGELQAAVNRQYGIVVRREGSDLVAYQRQQVISGEQLKTLSAEQKEVIQSYEKSMLQFHERWKDTYAKRSKAPSPKELKEIDRQLATLVREMKKDLHAVLDFLTRQGMVLEDHYAKIRALVDNVASRV